MIPARHASLRARPGLIRCAGVQLRCLQPAHQGVHGHGDHDGGGDATGLAGAGRWGRSRCTPRTPPPAGARRASGFGCLPVHAGPVLRCRDRQQLLPQHRPVQGGDGEPAVTLPVPVLDHPERRGRRRLPLLGVQLLGFVGLADLRRDDLQDPVPQDPQLPGVVVDGVPDQRSPAHPPRPVGRGRRAAPRPPPRSPGPGRPAACPPPAPPGSARTPPTRAPWRAGSCGAPRHGSASWRAPTSSPSTWHPSRPPPPRSGRGGRPGAAARRSGPPAGSARPSPPGSRPRSSTRPVRPGPSSGCRRSGQPRTGSGVPDRWCPRCSP